MKKHKNILVLCPVVAVVALVLMGVIAVGASETAEELALVSEEGTAEAILTSANVDSSTVISVPVVYYDQEADACVNMYDAGQLSAMESRQFEWTECGYYSKDLESGLVEYELDDSYLPMAVSGGLLSNRGLDFTRWFAEVEGVSKFYTDELNLGYNAETTSFEYGSEVFYPLNEIAGVNRVGVNEDGNNHLFTMSFGVPFRVLKSGKESFVISADDDTWVFVNDKLVLDMGGVHDVTTAVFRINEEGEIYESVEGIDFAYSGVKLEEDSAIVRIFHADRDSENSVFKLKFTDMVLNITNASIAKRDGGVELAYNPMDPSYVAPLGESITVKPDNRHLLAVQIVVQVVAIGGFGVLAVMAISLGLKYWRRDHSREG